MTPDDLFLCTLEDLEGRLTGPKPGQVVGRTQEYELLMVAGLLRKLLIDAGSLVVLVNRERRLRLRFSVSGWPWASGGSGGGRVNIRRRSRSSDEIPVVPLDQLAPELLGLVQERLLTLDQMLAEPIVIWNDVPITAKGLISYGANIGGGVHVGGQPRGPVHEALYGFGEEVFVDGYTLASACLRDVGEVAVSGLQPLRTAIESDRGPSGVGG